MKGSTKAAAKFKKIGGAVTPSSKPNAPGTKTAFSIGVAKNSEKLPSRSGPFFTQKMATAKFHATRGGSSIKKKLGGRY
jgi:hypothetical protein